jgi:hypothetical protein
MCYDSQLDVLRQVLEGEHFAGIVCQVTDGASQKPLSNIPIPVSSMFGTGKHPRILPQKRILERNSVLIYTLSNLYTTSEANVDSIIISLQGTKIYRSFQS